MTNNVQVFVGVHYDIDYHVERYTKEIEGRPEQVGPHADRGGPVTTGMILQVILQGLITATYINRYCHVKYPKTEDLMDLFPPLMVLNR